jgi:hypothetical protein
MSLSGRERVLVAQTQREHLKTLDEDQLGDLLVRVRRERNKQVSLHREGVRQRAAQERSRGVASAAPARAASKAEIFEQALARVSTELARAARRSAAELKAERLEAARAASGAPVARRSRRAAPKAAAKAAPRARTRPPVEKKAAAATLAAGARRQAERDSR